MRKSILLVVLTLICCWPSQAKAGEQRYAHLYATSGTGTQSDPWGGWQGALGQDVHTIFIKGYFQTPDTATNISSNATLSGTDGSILTWPSNRVNINTMLRIPAGTSDVVIDGLHFEAGFPDPLTNPQAGGVYISIGTAYSTDTVSRVRIQHNRFGIAMAWKVYVESSVTDLIVQNNFSDAGHNIFILSGGSPSTQYVYNQIEFIDNLVSFSETVSQLGTVVALGWYPYDAVPARFDTVTISGNTITQGNETMIVAIPGTNLKISDNNVRSDNIDSFLQWIMPPGYSVAGFSVTDNLCYAEDPSGDPNKIFQPMCLLKVYSATDGIISGNYLRGESETSVQVGASARVSVLGNTVNKLGSGPRCFMTWNSSDQTWSNNTCIDVGGLVFDFAADPLTRLSFVDNEVITTGATSIAESFFGGNALPVSSIARGNRVSGRNLSGLFGGTSLSSSLNIETVAETGIRVGSDRVSDLTGTNLGVVAGALSVTGPIDATKIANGMVSNTEYQYVDTLVSDSMKIDAKGDLLVGTGNDAVEKLSVASDGRLLGASSTSLTGLAYFDQRHDLSFFRQVGTPERWYVAGHLLGTLGQTSYTANILRAVPFLSGRGGTLNGLGTYVTTKGSANKNMRICFYENASDTNLYPTNLVLDSGALTISSTGFKTVTISLSLPPNQLYWMAHFQDDTASIRSIPATQSLIVLGSSSGLDAAPGLGWSVASTFASCPSVFPTGGSVIAGTDVPALAVRYSN